MTGSNLESFCNVVGSNLASFCSVCSKFDSLGGASEGSTTGGGTSMEARLAESDVLLGKATGSIGCMFGVSWCTGLSCDNIDSCRTSTGSDVKFSFSTGCFSTCVKSCTSAGRFVKFSFTTGCVSSSVSESDPSILITSESSLLLLCKAELFFPDIFTDCST
uniref:Uncharacterized protein n=1 Tax=Cacopsylla melanoneura TaxID=428564 RepID=A0A8D8XNF2_9HEMI